MAEERKISIHTRVYEAAKKGDMELTQELVRTGGCIDMAIMGADDGQHKDIKNWAFENGASLIFGFKNESRPQGKLLKQFKTQNVMLGGPGEVARG
jgi:hypothetical protein